METKLLNKLRTIQYLAETCNLVIYDEAVEAVAMLEEIIEANQFTSDLILRDSVADGPFYSPDKNRA